jgi:ClpP class serine protease
LLPTPYLTTATFEPGIAVRQSFFVDACETIKVSSKRSRHRHRHRFRFIEDLRDDKDRRNRLAVILTSPGGSAETVEKLVDIIRHHYGEVYFVIPDEAMSAGTIFAMSGDKIFMDYTSSLGPIDPQVRNGKEWVPALGYLARISHRRPDQGRNPLPELRKRK